MLVKTIKKKEISAVTGRAYTRKFIEVTNEVHKAENYDEKKGSVIEEVILYCFLGIFIIYLVDSFVKVGKYVR